MTPTAKPSPDMVERAGLFVIEHFGHYPTCETITIMTEFALAELALAQPQAPSPVADAKFTIGMQVEKFTGDYQLAGEVRGVFTTKAGKLRCVVEHDPGFLHIYNEGQLRSLPAAPGEKS